MLVWATIYGTNEWNILRGFITGRKLDYFHYFGHGSGSAIGGGVSGHSTITLNQLRSSSILTSNRLTYVALDGCRTLVDKDFIEAFTGYRGPVSRFTLAQQGRNPHFGCGWDNSKQYGWIRPGGTTVYDDHFWFWQDFYYDLTRRDQSGLMFRQYKQAYQFAKEPGGSGVSHTLQTNSEATGFKWVGCEDCRFDERPGIVQ